MSLQFSSVMSICARLKNGPYRLARVLHAIVTGNKYDKQWNTMWISIWNHCVFGFTYRTQRFVYLCRWKQM